MPPFEKLFQFISKDMRMSHIYQPVVLLELLKSGGHSTISKIAAAISSRDPSQIEYYEPIVKNMPGKVLSSHGLIEKVKQGSRTTGFALIDYDSLSDEQTTTLIEQCEHKLDEYLVKRGERIWSHRRNRRTAISGTTRYTVLKRAKYRCELCGVLDKDKALEVDHIVPKNHGGSDELSNFQALCFSCNASKGDRDDTDLRGIAASYANRDKGCLFCETLEDRPIIAQNELCYAIHDKYPVTPLHTLVIPKRHVEDYFGLYQPEKNAVDQLLNELKNTMLSEDPSITGFNIGMNCGIDAGQTIMHCHVHLIPRRKGDIDVPRGGVRGVIPDKQQY